MCDIESSFVLFRIGLSSNARITIRIFYLIAHQSSASFREVSIRERSNKHHFIQTSKHLIGHLMILDTRICAFWIYNFCNSNIPLNKMFWNIWIRSDRNKSDWFGVEVDLLQQIYPQINRILKNDSPSGLDFSPHKRMWPLMYVFIILTHSGDFSIKYPKAFGKIF